MWFEHIKEGRIRIGFLTGLDFLKIREVRRTSSIRDWREGGYKHRFAAALRVTDCAPLPLRNFHDDRQAAGRPCGAPLTRLLVSVAVGSRPLGFVDWFQLAEVAVPHALFAAILRRI